MGAPFLVNTYQTGRQRDPAVAMNRAGEFVVVWRGENQPGDEDEGIFGRRFAPDATPLDAEEFHVNSSTLGTQAHAGVSLDGNGRFLVTWWDVSSARVYGQIFGPGRCPASDSDADGVCDDDDDCPGTNLDGDAPEVRLGVHRWADVDGDGTFETAGPSTGRENGPYTLEQTRGCTCRQILSALHLGEGQAKYGCATGVMDRWISLEKAEP